MEKSSQLNCKYFTQIDEFIPTCALFAFRVYSGAGRTKKLCTKRGSQSTVIPWSLAHTASNNSHWSGAFGRLRSSSFFPTVITKLSPLKRNGKCIHPTLDRYITVREVSRAQTFPDRFCFDGNRDEAVKEVSNTEIAERGASVMYPSFLKYILVRIYIYHFNEFFQIGNAVPPLLAQTIGCAILHQIRPRIQFVR